MATVAAKCREILTQDHRPGFIPRFSYVPMDLIWLLAQHEPEATDALDAILAAMPRDYGFERTFYENLLPTVGASVARLRILGAA